jgi:AcrR family transcriptional regulator
MSVARQSKEQARTQAQRRREAEANIVQAALDIVSKRGMDQLTLAEAGERAGYSRALPAHYFSGREALLAAVAEHCVELYRRRLVEKKVPSAEGLDAVLEAIAFYIDDSRNWTKRLRAFHEVTNAALRWPSIAVVVAQLNNQSTQRFAERIRAAQRLGQIRSDLDPGIEASIILAGLRGIMANWLVSPDTVDLDSVRDSYIAGLRRSLRP